MPFKVIAQLPYDSTSALHGRNTFQKPTTSDVLRYDRRTHNKQDTSAIINNTNLANTQRKCAENYKKRHDKFIFLTAISTSVISNHNSFRLLFDKIASVYSI